MTIIVNNEERVIQLQLASQQGPAGASTVAAQNAALGAQESQLAAAQSATEALMHRNEAEMFADNSAASASDSFDSAQASALSASQSAASAELAQDQVDFIAQNYYPTNSYGTYAEALEGALTDNLPVGTVVFIVNDERFQNARTFCRVEEVLTAASFDFSSGTYQTSSTLEFLAYAGVEIVDPPVLSSDIGFKGALAVDETYLYVYTGTVWKRITLGAF